MRRQVTALPPYGGITSPLLIGAVVDGVPITSQTPLSGQRSPVLAVVPMATATLNPLLQPVRAAHAGRCPVANVSKADVTLAACQQL